MFCRAWTGEDGNLDSVRASFEVLADEHGLWISLWPCCINPPSSSYACTESAATVACCLPGQHDANLQHRSIIQTHYSKFSSDYVLLHFHSSMTSHQLSSNLLLMLILGKDGICRSSQHQLRSYCVVPYLSADSTKKDTHTHNNFYLSEHQDP